MNILVVTDAYPPEIRSSSLLMAELATELVAMGHKVHVLTSWPKYNLEESDRARTFAPSSLEAGVRVIRVRTLPHHNVGFALRGLAQLSMPWLFLRALRARVREPIGAVVVYSPPLPLALVGEAVRRRGARYVLNVQDLFPQNAIDLGILRNPALIAFFRWMEHRAYAQADIVTAHSAANRNLIVDRYPHFDSKVRVLPNWIGAGAPPKSDPRDFRGQWGLEGRFVALFAGVIGPSQSLDMLLTAAAATRHIPDLVYLIVGDGAEKPRLVERAAAEGLANIMFKPFVSAEDYPALVKAADLGLVCLSALNTTPVVPGKILGYMAGGKPIAAFLNAQSEGHDVIRQAGCGYSCVSDRPDEIVAILSRLYRERASLADLGAAGSAYAQAHFSRQGLIHRLESWLASD